MTSETISNGLKYMCLAGFVPNMCPKKLATRGHKLISVAPGVCWYEPFKVPTKVWSNYKDSPMLELWLVPATLGSHRYQTKTPGSHRPGELFGQNISSN